MTKNMSDISALSPDGQSATIRPHGIRGWLLLPIIGLYFSIFSWIRDNPIEFAKEISIFFNNKNIILVLWAEFILDCVIYFTIPLGLLIYAYCHQSIFSKLLVIYIWVYPIWMLVSASVRRYFLELSWPDQFEISFPASILSSIIWTGYMLKSERVRNTFVRTLSQK
jgi:hypothetical protein